MPRIVLHAGACADLREHFQIVCGAHGETLRFKFLALLMQFGGTLVKFLLDGFERPFHTFRSGNVMRGREDVHLRFVRDHVAGQRMQRGDAVDFAAEEFDADGQFLVYGDDLNGVAAHAECASREGDVVALVLHVHEFAQ